MTEDEQRHQQQLEFLNIVIEAAETGDKTRLAAWWRKHYPGWKMWLVGPCFSAILPDDGRIEP